MSNTNKATLSPEGHKTFFRLFIPLLDFTNQKYEINEYLSEDMRRGHPDMQDLKEVADVLWANPETIDEYIGSTEKLEITRKQEKNKVYKRFLCIYNTPKYGISVKNHTFWGR